MAEPINCTRTNYFHVKDADKFREFMDELGDVDVFTRDPDLFGFGCYDSISGIYDEEKEEYDYEGFLKTLQELIADGEAVIIMESGHEKLRYVSGNITVVTSNDIKSLDMTTTAKAMARQMLNDPSYDPDCEY